MVEIIGVRFKHVGKIYYFDPCDFIINKDDNVIVETARGIEYGKVVIGRRTITESEITQPLKKVLRLATSEDAERFSQNKIKEKEAFDLCIEKVQKHKLNMKLVDTEYTFDGNKLLFYFTADGRVDFRELVKDLANIFRTRIELRQIGVRDEAKILNSYGICGRELCCAKFLGDFHPVSIKMAKEQGMSLNPTKISGTCGRLMCCLKYEQEAYEHLTSITPRVGAVVETPSGKGVVEYVNILKGKLKIKIGTDKENVLQEFNVSEVKIIKNSSYKSEKSDFNENIDPETLKLLEDK